MRVAADNQIDPVSSQKPGQLPLHLVRSTFVFVAPVHAGDHAIHAVVLDRRQVRGDPHRVDGIDRQSGRDRKTVRTVGVVQQGETYAARFETERMPRPEIRAVQKNARMFDAVPVEFPDRRTDAFRSAVAAVVVGQYGNVHAQGVECLGQSRRGAEAGVTRIGSGFGKGGFEIDDRCIGRTEALPHPVERGIEIEIAFRRTRCGELGRMLHLRFADTVALAKFGNLLFYILVVFFAIRLAKRYQGLVALVALLPNSVFLASALTYDAVVNSFLLLGMVLVTNELISPEEKLTWQNTLLILLSFAIGCQSKPIYVVMVLMLLFLGRKKFYNRPQEIVYKLALLIMAGLMLYNIFRPTPAAGSDYYLVGNFDFAGDKRNIGTSVTGQLQYILQNPFTYALLLLKSMVQLLGTYLSGGADFFQYGYLGTGSTIFTWIVIVLGLWLALWSAKGVKRWKMPAVSIVLTLIMLLGTSAIVWSSMYVSYTTVGANEIRGVQGRYFIPLFLPFASCFFNNRLESRLGELARRRILYGVMMAVNLFMIYTLVITVINI